MRIARWPALVVACSATVAVVASDIGEPGQIPRSSMVGVLDEHPAIQYASRPTQDRVSVLSQAIALGTVSLDFNARGGYLRSVLEALGVPPASQVLVFSKTGIQSVHTSPRNPRALFFDDSVVVGYVPEAPYLELAAHDPEQGVVFYTIDQTATAGPRVTRRNGCLSCHVSSSTLEVLGLINRSMVTTADGGVLPQLGSHTVNHRTPLLHRWGGMYVTGNYTTPFYGRTEHMGNVTVAMHPSSGPVTTSNEVLIEWLHGDPPARGYTSSESDIATLMVFDHQMHAANLLTRVHWESRVAAGEGRLDVDRGAVRELVDELADYFLFVDEAPPPARLTPRPAFAERFTAAGPKDRRGRSLRELDLEHRLLRYPCSYMVYTRAFDALAGPVRHAVYRRIWTILSGDDERPKYAHLSPADRRAIVDILRDTKTDLPEFFR